MIYTSLLVISEIKISCNYLNWGKKIQTETIQFSDIISHNLTVMLNITMAAIHKHILLQHYVFTRILYFYAMCLQKYFTSTLCVHNNILLPHCVHKNMLLPHYVFTKVFYFYPMCSKKYFTSTLCVHKSILLLPYEFKKIFYFYTMCSQKYFTSTLCVHKNILLPHYVFTTIVYFRTMWFNKI
jgi:hypothetical protein